MTPLSAEVEAALERSDDIVKRGLSLNAAVCSTLAAEVRRLHARVRELTDAMLTLDADNIRYQSVIHEQKGELAAARADGERYRFLRDMKCNHFSLSLNEDPAINYVTVQKFIETFDPEWLHDIEPSELQKMKDTNTIWWLQIYPNTPIGFNVYYGASLDAAIDAALKP